MRTPACRLLPAALAALLVAAPPALAVIVKLIPLKEVIADEQLIFVAAVDTVDPARPAVVFKLDQKLKGDVPFDRLPVNLTGDAEAKKDRHTQVMLDRLEPGRKLVVFATVRGKKYSAFGFLEGTWFQMQGTPGDDGKTVRWAFLHCEPYLRRTFKGTTEEMKKAVEDALAKRAAPPGVNEKEPPGFGPPVKKKDGGDPASGGGQPPEGACDQRPRGSRGAAPPRSPVLFAVIPSFVLVGPLAIIAALFPGVAAKLAVGMKRWRAFLVVASVNSTLAICHYFARPYLPDVWVVSSQGFTVLLLCSTLVGLGWAGRRYRRLAAEDPAVTATPTRRELSALVGFTLFTGLLVASVRLFGPWKMALEAPMREFTFIGIGLLAATVYAAYRYATRHADHLPDGTEPPVRLSLSGELVGLLTLLLCGLTAVLLTGPAGGPATVMTATEGDAGAIGPRLVGVQVYEVPDAHQVLSGVTVAGDRLFFGAAKQTGLTGVYGYVFCLDRHSGKKLWRFDADEELKPVFCTPTVTDGVVYFGEGLHTDSGCKLYAVPEAGGKPVWEHKTTSHTEGSPRVSGGRVFFSAGDDGLICADAKTGAKVWHCEGAPKKLHIDTPAAVAGGRVFAGSGYDTFALLGLDAATGNEVWRVPVPLRSFGPPLVSGKAVFYGLGTGNLTLDTEGDEKEPAGAVVCLDAATGKEQWKYDLGRSVHAPLAADAFSVYACSRDGHVHCLDRTTGKLRWKTPIGGAVTAGAAVAAGGGVPVAVYAVSREGNAVCLNPHTGRVVWRQPLPGFHWNGQDAFGVLSTPAVVTEGNKRTVYIGGMKLTQNSETKTCAVFRFDDEIGE